MLKETLKILNTLKLVLKIPMYGAGRVQTLR